MNSFWLKLRVWTKVTIFVAVAIYLLFFLIFNTGDDKRVALWVWFGQNGEPSLPVLVFIPMAFMAGVITTLLVRTILRTVTQLREMKRRRLEREAAAVVARAAKLRVREQLAKTEGRGFDVVTPGTDGPL